MKKYLLIAVAALAVAAISCNKDKEVTKDKEEKSDYTKLVINEVNATAATDAEKFVEFYNGGDKACSLEGVTIKRTDETNTTEEVWAGLAGENSS